MTDIKIIGTSHIAQVSIELAKKEIQEFKPDIVGVELDRGRYQSLITKEKSHLPLSAIFKIGFLGYVFAKFGSWGSRKLGKLVGVSPGDEMLAAIKEAKKVKAKIALVDQPIEITLARFSRQITWKEKWNFVVDIFRAMFFRKKVAKELGLTTTFDLSKVPSGKIIAGLMNIMKKRYPNVYKVLVFERNVYMIKNIVSLKVNYPNAKILVFVGAGHVQGMVELIKNMRVKVGKSSK